MAHVDGLPEMRLWRLDRIASVDLLDRGFTREDFDLTAYAEQSFGVFQENPIDVMLRFTPEAARDASGWRFHPSQKTERERDGALIVRFHAGGMQEMCWYLFTWGGAVTILAPEDLRLRLAELASTAAAHHMEQRAMTMTPCGQHAASNVQPLAVGEIAAWALPHTEGTQKPKPLAVLPKLQRSPVWKSEQIERLWDLLTRGFPIGSFLVSPRNGR